MTCAKPVKMGTVPIVGTNESIGQYRACLQITRRCDLRCSYCSVPIVNATRALEMLPDQWVTVLDNLKKLGATVVTFSGGEPFLRPDILAECVPYAIKLGLYPRIETDGRQLYDKPGLQRLLLDLHRKGLQALSVGIDQPLDWYDPRAIKVDDPGEKMKSWYGYHALTIAQRIGLTDLEVIACMDDTDPTTTVSLLQNLDGRYKVHISLVQRRAQTGVNAFQSADPTKLTLDQEKALKNALRVVRDGRHRFNVTNTETFFNWVQADVYKDWACSAPGYVVVGSDGRLQLCKNIFGHELITQLNLSTPQPDDLQQIYDHLWRCDLRGHCPGCFLSYNVEYHARQYELVYPQGAHDAHT